LKGNIKTINDSTSHPLLFVIAEKTRCDVHLISIIKLS